MSRTTPSRVLVIGVGNEYRGDDGVGLLVARRLKEMSPARIAVVEQNGEGTALMDAWEGAEAVILIDAAKSGARAGSVCYVDAHAGPLPAKFLRCSTHAFGVAEAVELARALKCLPGQFVIYAIAGGNFEPGMGLSAEMETAAREVTSRVLAEACRASMKGNGVT